MSRPADCLRRCCHCQMMPVSIPACADADDVVFLCEDCAEDFVPCPGCALPRYLPDPEPQDYRDRGAEYARAIERDDANPVPLPLQSVPPQDGAI